MMYMYVQRKRLYGISEKLTYHLDQPQPLKISGDLAVMQQTLE